MSAPVNDGGPAFAHGNHEQGGDAGMSLRDYFAGQFFAGAVTSGGDEIVDMPLDADADEVRASHFEYWSHVALAAYAAADAMLAAREVQS